VTNGEGQAKKKLKFYNPNNNIPHEGRSNDSSTLVGIDNECRRNRVRIYKEIMPRVSVKTSNYL